jgi:hypothetical protein
MEALYNRNGHVHAWLHETGKIYDLYGRNLAFVDGNSVYTWNGAHIAWWADGHIRDQSGAVALFTADATNLGVARPMRALRPLRPLRALSPLRPLKAMKPMRPTRVAAWSYRMPL